MYNAFTINLALSYLVTGIVLTALGIFVIRHQPVTNVKRKFAIYSFTIASWALTSIPHLLAPYHISFFFSRVLLTAVIFIPITFFDFIATYLGIVKRRLQRSLYLFSLPFLLSLWFTDWFCKAVAPMYKLPNFTIPGPAYYVFIVFYVLTVALGLILLRIHIKRAKDPTMRLSMQFLFWSTFVGYLGGHFNFNIVFDIEPKWLAPWGTYMIAVYGIIVFITIIRYKLLNISVAIRKGLIYSGLITTTSLVLFIILVLAHQLLGSLLPISDKSHVFLLTLLLCAFFLPVYHFIQDKVFRLLFKRPLTTILNDLDKLYLNLSDSERHRMAATLASSLAHEIRNPLTAIRAYMECAPHRKADPKFWVKFEEITTREIQRIDSLLTELMDFARARKLHMKPHDLNEVARQTLDLAGSRIRDAHIELRLDLQEPAVAVMDSQQIQQVILNLLLNAVEAMPDGGTLTITTEKQSPVPNHQLRLIISDTGCGMTPEQTKHIFDPFYTTKEGGHGLGMAVVKQIVESHGWEIRVNSEPNRGTTFTIISGECV